MTSFLFFLEETLHAILSACGDFRSWHSVEATKLFSECCIFLIVLKAGDRTTNTLSVAFPIFSVKPSHHLLSRSSLLDKEMILEAPRKNERGKGHLFDDLFPSENRMF